MVGLVDDLSDNLKPSQTWSYSFQGLRACPLQESANKTEQGLSRSLSNFTAAAKKRASREI